MNKKIILILSLFFSVSTIFSQTPAAPNDKISPETKKQAVALLHETFGDVNSLRTLENRISFSSELASLLWYEDEKEARSMFTAMIGDFNQLLAQYDSQLSSLGGEFDDNPYYGVPFLGGGDESEKAKVMRKFVRAMSVRQQIAASLAEHDAKFAFDFYDNSLRLVTNAKLREKFEKQDGYFQTKLLQQIAESDPTNALDYGRRSVAKGLNYGQIDLLKKIYAKDADKGAEFAQTIADKVKTEKIEGENYYFFDSFFRTGSENFEKSKQTGKKPMLTEQNLRDLAEIAAQTALNEDGRMLGGDNLDLIEKYAPSRAAQIKARNNAEQAKSGIGNSNVKMSSGRMISNSANLMMSNSSGMMSNSSGMMSNSYANSNVNREAQTADKLAANLKSLTAQASKEEREKAVAQARKTINEELPSKLARITALSALAAQVAGAGDKELAEQIMGDAQNLVNLQPKNYLDYTQILMLVSGYSQVAPEKAFPILDDSIFRLNDTLTAMVKIGEFVDVSGEMIDNGEVQVGTLSGGELGQMTSGLALADGTLRRLAIADFDKTRGLTNRFDRPEARILAKMLVLRAVLGDKQIAGQNKLDDNF